MQSSREMGRRAEAPSTELSTASVDKGEAQIEPSARPRIAGPDGVPGTDGRTLAESRAESKNPLRPAGTSPKLARPLNR